MSAEYELVMPTSTMQDRLLWLLVRRSWKSLGLKLSLRYVEMRSRNYLYSDGYERLSMDAFRRVIREVQDMTSETED
jgi:hypothetical protein